MYPSALLSKTDGSASGLVKGDKRERRVKDGSLALSMSDCKDGDATSKNKISRERID